ncbi:MAG TPA: hypothetical protein VNN08_23255 [Thermoanaerobaculia bacterium]|nr:hypothetical protein [Thermoanaerobaculia bacterium]
MKIPEIRLRADPASDEARAAVGFKWNDEAGNRHKIGGAPEWIQTPDVPVCASCSEPMSFYGQLDSVGDDFSLADCGMVYVFVCFSCFTTRAVLQSG